MLQGARVGILSVGLLEGLALRTGRDRKEIQSLQSLQMVHLWVVGGTGEFPQKKLSKQRKQTKDRVHCRLVFLATGSGQHDQVV